MDTTIGCDTAENELSKIRKNEIVLFVHFSFQFISSIHSLAGCEKAVGFPDRKKNRPQLRHRLLGPKREGAEERGQERAVRKEGGRTGERRGSHRSERGYTRRGSARKGSGEEKQGKERLDFSSFRIASQRR